MKISELQEEFLRYKSTEENSCQSTLDKYKDCFKRFIGLEGDLDVENITFEHTMDIKEKLKKQNLSPARIASIIFSIRGLLRYCKNKKQLNVIDFREIKAPERDNPHVVYYTNAEVKLLMSVIDTSNLHGLRLRALCEVLLYSGARIHEALQLNRNSIIKDHDKEGNDVYYAYILGKGKKERKIYFSDSCIFWINKYLENRTDDNIAMFVTHNFDIHRLKINSCSRDFLKMKIDSGISKPVHPHIFRHTFCTNLAKNGAKFAHIQRMAGHGSVQVTIRYYINIDDEDLIQTRRMCLNFDN